MNKPSIDLLPVASHEVASYSAMVRLILAY